MQVCQAIKGDTPGVNQMKQGSRKHYVCLAGFSFSCFINNASTSHTIWHWTNEKSLNAKSTTTTLMTSSPPFPVFVKHCNFSCVTVIIYIKITLLNSLILLVAFKWCRKASSFKLYVGGRRFWIVA